MYTTIKEKVGMLILVMLLICGAVNAQHWRHYCYYPSNRIVTVVVKPDMLHYISNRFNRKERLAMAMAYLKTNKYLTIKQYAKMTQPVELRQKLNWMLLPWIRKIPYNS